ncbi:MAG: potassium channel family protein [Candidatus Saccharimonadales bacterium]
MASSSKINRIIKTNKRIRRNAFGIRLVTFLVVVVLVTGIMFYHFVEKLSWLNATYFSVMTITTVGYGDISPTTDGGKIFTMGYVLVGLILIAVLANLLIKSAVARHIIK